MTAATHQRPATSPAARVEEKTATYPTSHATAGHSILEKMKIIEKRIAARNAISLKAKITYKLVAVVLCTTAFLSADKYPIVFLGCLISLFLLYFYVQYLYHHASEKTQRNNSDTSK
ncbi:hypothetical protein V1358_11420 [Pseudoalteromonas sp. YIC-656]|uniref:hypothetical protein n=1 Tax=Pseudoalteromonas pernae TaxID=3118054 RepID=UPI003242DE36